MKKANETSLERVQPAYPFQRRAKTLSCSGQHLHEGTTGKASGRGDKSEFRKSMLSFPATMAASFIGLTPDLPAQIGRGAATIGRGLPWLNLFLDCFLD